MISTFFELGGFGVLILGAYEWSGRVAALIVLGFVMLLIGWVLEGASLRLPWRETSKKRPLRLKGEPLTNREVDGL